jgi:hypothetical protein
MLAQNGVNFPEASLSVRTGAGKEATDVRKACARGGGSDLTCETEAREEFQRLGGDEELYQTQMETARIRQVEDVLTACLQDTTAHSAKDSCKEDAKSLYTSMGGDIGTVELELRKAAGNAANSNMKVCFSQYGGQISAATRDACVLQARGSFEMAGGEIDDFERDMFEAARRDTGSALQICLKDAGCKSNEDGLSECADIAKQIACYDAAYEGYSRGIGNAEVTPTDIREAELEAGHTVIKDEMFGCAQERSSKGTVEVTVDGVSHTCKGYFEDDPRCQAETARECITSARVAYGASGGSDADFEIELKTVSQTALKDETKSCVLENLASPNLTSPSGTPGHCTGVDRRSARFEECADAAISVCANRAKKSIRISRWRH